LIICLVIRSGRPNEPELATGLTRQGGDRLYIDLGWHRSGGSDGSEEGSSQPFSDAFGGSSSQHNVCMQALRVVHKGVLPNLGKRRDSRPKYGWMDRDRHPTLAGKVEDVCGTPVHGEQAAPRTPRGIGQR
jgi:hypothetical protein